MERWTEVFPGVIPKSSYYFCEVVNGERGLKITLFDKNCEVTIDFDIAAGLRMYEEGYVLNELPPDDVRESNYANTIYRIHDGDFLKETRKKAGEAHEDREWFHFAIVTMDYYIEVVDQWEPEITVKFTRSKKFDE